MPLIFQGQYLRSMPKSWRNFCLVTQIGPEVREFFNLKREHGKCLLAQTLGEEGRSLWATFAPLPPILAPPLFRTKYLKSKNDGKNAPWTISRPKNWWRIAEYIYWKQNSPCVDLDTNERKSGASQMEEKWGEFCFISIFSDFWTVYARTKIYCQMLIIGDTYVVYFYLAHVVTESILCDS